MGAGGQWQLLTSPFSPVSALVPVEHVAELEIATFLELCRDCEREVRLRSCRELWAYLRSLAHRRP